MSEWFDKLKVLLGGQPDRPDVNMNPADATIRPSDAPALPDAPPAPAATPDVPLLTAPAPAALPQRPPLPNFSVPADNVNTADEVRKYIMAKYASDRLPRTLGVAADSFSEASGLPSQHLADAVDKRSQQDIASKTAQLEGQGMDDPNSNDSKMYQNSVATFLGKKPGEFKNYSGNQIKNTFPMVEKFMTHRDAQDALAATKTSTQQDKLEQEYRLSLQKQLSNRSGGLGLQDQKVNSAIHARQLIEGNRNPKTGEVDLNQVATPELAMTLANIVSGSNTTPLEEFKLMSPQSLHQYIMTKVGYLTGKPTAVLPQEWVAKLTQMIDRQGLTSEQLRDHYTAGIKSMRPTDLDPARAAALEKEGLGSSYADSFGLKRLAPVTPGKPGVAAGAGNPGKPANDPMGLF